MSTINLEETVAAYVREQDAVRAELRAANDALSSELLAVKAEVTRLRREAATPAPPAEPEPSPEPEVSPPVAELIILDERNGRGLGQTANTAGKSLAYRDAVIRGRADLLPGLTMTKYACGINVLGGAEEVLIERVEVDNAVQGFVLQGDRHRRMKRAIIRRCFVHSFNNHLNTGSLRDRKTNGLFASDLDELIIEDSLFIGMGPRDVFSHCAYMANRIGIVTINRSCFFDAPSHGINADRVECHDVIVGGCPVNFGVKEAVGTWSGCISLAPSLTPIVGDGPPAPRGWHEYGDHPLGNAIERRDDDPVDRAAVAAYARRPEMFDVARSFLPGAGQP